MVSNSKVNLIELKESLNSSEDISQYVFVALTIEEIKKISSKKEFIKFLSNFTSTKKVSSKKSSELEEDIIEYLDVLYTKNLVQLSNFVNNCYPYGITSIDYSWRLPSEVYHVPVIKWEAKEVHLDYRYHTNISDYIRYNIELEYFIHRYMSHKNIINKDQEQLFKLLLVIHIKMLEQVPFTDDTTKFNHICVREILNTGQGSLRTQDRRVVFFKRKLIKRNRSYIDDLKINVKTFNSAFFENLKTNI